MAHVSPERAHRLEMIYGNNYIESNLAVIAGAW
jgi:hypothetical protein